MRHLMGVGIFTLMIVALWMPDGLANAQSACVVLGAVAALFGDDANLFGVNQEGSTPIDLDSDGLNDGFKYQEWVSINRPPALGCLLVYNVGILARVDDLQLHLQPQLGGNRNAVARGIDARVLS